MWKTEKRDGRWHAVQFAVEAISGRTWRTGVVRGPFGSRWAAEVGAVIFNRTGGARTGSKDRTRFPPEAKRRIGSYKDWFPHGHGHSLGSPGRETLDFLREHNHLPWWECNEPEVGCHFRRKESS